MTDSKLRNIIKYVAPTVLSQVCFFMFTIIDGIFVGNGVGTEALAAVNMAFPFVMIISALVSMISLGGSIMSAIQLGQGNVEDANKAFRHSSVLILLISAVLCIAGICFTDSLCNLLGANETYYEYLHNYLSTYALFIIPSSFSMLFQFFGRNDNIPGVVGFATILSTACNIALDWLFVFPLEMGIMGAALATGISQIIGLCVLLPHFLMKKGVFTFGRIKMDGSVVKEVVVNGLPIGIGQLSPAVMTLCMNLVLIYRIGDIGVNAFSIISYVASFVVAIFNGTSEGLQPLLGQSYGAEQKEELRYYFKAGMWISFVGGMIVTGLLLLVSRPICVMFGADTQTLEYVLEVMPLYSWGFIVQGLNMMLVAYLYSTEKAKEATIISVLRGIVFAVAVTFGVPAILGSTSVWLTMGIYEIMSLVVAVLLLRKVEYKIR